MLIIYYIKISASAFFAGDVFSGHYSKNIFKRKIFIIICFHNGGKHMPDNKKSILSQPAERSRRAFLKIAGAAAVGGLSSLALPHLSGNGSAGASLRELPYGNAGSELYWAGVQNQFCLDPRITYLNTGTEGSMPKSVLNRLHRYSEEFARSPMESCFYSGDLGYVQEKNIDRVAEFLGVPANDIVLTNNTTQGMHIAILGLDFAPGDEIITTLHEHGASLSPLHHQRDRRGVVIKALALPTPATSKQDIIDLFARAITDKTRALCFCHVNFTTGLRMPVKELCDLAKEHNLISIVDGAHAIGMLNVTLDALGCDFYATSGHKWLNGPPGTGMLYIRDGNKNPRNLWPEITEIYDISYATPITSKMQMRGQLNTPSLQAMTDAMAFQQSIGRDNVEARVLELAAYLKEKIVGLWGEASLLSPAGGGELCSGLVSFTPFQNFADRYDMGLITGITRPLRDTYKTYIRFVEFFDREADAQKTYALRVSTHIFNSRRDIDALLRAIQTIINS
jgi:selenocysteine lyase/cysteine desulfurase